MRDFSLTTRLKHLDSGTTFLITNVYGPSSWDGKEDFRDELVELKGVCGGIWSICGDFNLTRNPLERRGRVWCRRLSTMFNDLINTLELIDLPLANQNFTWSNMQSSPTLAKLDRFLISTEWDQAFPLTRVVAMPRITSDHNPILLSTGDKVSRHLFRFEEMWLTREDFCKLVPIW